MKLMKQVVFMPRSRLSYYSEVILGFANVKKAVRRNAEKVGAVEWALERRRTRSVGNVTPQAGEVLRLARLLSP
jgi:hypothetical protein